MILNLFSKKDLIQAHKHCANHKEELLNSQLCGCFSCEHIFPPSEIQTWFDDTINGVKGETSQCPKCGIDAVIGSKSGFPVTKRFLHRMRKYYF